MNDLANSMLGFIVLALVATLWLIITLWPATIAKRKGHSFILWFLISLPFWWITLFVTTFLLEDRTLSAPVPTEEA